MKMNVLTQDFIWLSLFLFIFACSTQESTQKRHNSSDNARPNLEYVDIETYALLSIEDDLDGKVDEEKELAWQESELPQTIEQRQAQLLETYDSNKDGELDASEREQIKHARDASRLAKCDTNGDGKIDASEKENLRKNLVQKVKFHRQRIIERVMSKVEKCQARDEKLALDQATAAKRSEERAAEADCNKGQPVVRPEKEQNPNAEQKMLSGYDIKGQKGSCAFPSSDLICTKEIRPEDGFAEECRRFGHEVFQCACHNYLCSENIANESIQQGLKPQQEIAEDEQAAFHGFNIDGKEASCQAFDQKTSCTKIITAGDRFAGACRSLGHKAFQCGCHEYICSQKIGDGTGLPKE